MKTTKRIFAMLLCLMMVCAMSLTAFAADEYTITINNPASGYTYSAYQIFKGDLSADGKLSNIDWGTGVNTADTAAIYAALAAKNSEFAGCDSAADVADKLAGKSFDSQIAKDFADVIDAYLTSVAVTSVEGTATGEGENIVYPYTITIPAADDGYYIVKNTGVPSESAAYTRYILEVTKDVTVTHKGTYASVTKKILDPTEVDVNEAGLNESVKYQLTGTIPSNIADYEEYFYQFNDTLAAGLTFQNDVKVMIGSEDVTKYFYVNEADGKITIAIQDLLALNKVAAGTVAAGKTVVVTYTAKLNENAVVTGNPNEVYLTYSNDPNNSGVGATTTPPENPTTPPTPDSGEPTGNTPKDEVVTYVTQLTVNKVDGTGAVLNGASFKLEGPNGYSKEFAAADGTAVFTGLAAGDYTLTETVTPEGYNTIDPITFTITFNAADKTFDTTRDDITVEDNMLEITVENVSGSQLPSTGGIGTTVFYVFGGFLAMAALVVLVARKRVEA